MIVESLSESDIVEAIAYSENTSHRSTDGFFTTRMSIAAGQRSGLDDVDLQQETVDEVSAYIEDIVTSSNNETSIIDGFGLKTGVSIEGDALK